MAVSRLFRLALHAAVALILLLALGWAAAALWIDGPALPAPAGTLAVGLVALAGLAAALIRPLWHAGVAVFAAVAAVLAWWLMLVPSNERDWQPDVARLPTATIDGSRLTLRNVRNFSYRAEQDFAERWETRTYDLDTLVGVDLFLSFWGPTLYGHTITSWEFADGRHLAVSIETRKEKGEDYSAVKGFFRQYELYYVVADERDVIGVRTGPRSETVQLYRVRGAADKGRALLLDYVKEINAIADRPRWYNALTQNCTTTIWLHTKAVGSGPSIDWRLLANGYLPDLAYERGTVNTTLGLEELKSRSDITARTRAASAGEDFSRAIREELPPRPANGSPDVATRLP